MLSGGVSSSLRSGAAKGAMAESVCAARTLGHIAGGRSLEIGVLRRSVRRPPRTPRAPPRTRRHRCRLAGGTPTSDASPARECRRRAAGAEGGGVPSCPLPPLVAVKSA